MQTVQSDVEFSSEQEQRYQTDGYVLLGQMLSELGFAEARTQLDRMIGQLHPDLHSDEIYSAHQIEPWLMELVSAPALLDIIEHVIEPNIVADLRNSSAKRRRPGEPFLGTKTRPIGTSRER